MQFCPCKRTIFTKFAYTDVGLLNLTESFSAMSLASPNLRTFRSKQLLSGSRSGSHAIFWDQIAPLLPRIALLLRRNAEVYLSSLQFVFSRLLPKNSDADSMICIGFTLPQGPEAGTAETTSGPANRSHSRNLQSF